MRRRTVPRRSSAGRAGPPPNPRPLPCCRPPLVPPLQVQIINKAGVKEANKEDEGFLIKDGIVVICKNAHITNGTVI